MGVVLSFEEERDRFWSRVAVAGPDECWVFLRKDRTPHWSYGEYWSPTFGSMRATRMALLLESRPIPATPGVKWVVMHTCDNPPCCNPAHLRVGTQSDNMRDKCAKGRHRSGHERDRIVRRLRARNSPRLATLGPEWFS